MSRMELLQKIHNQVLTDKKFSKPCGKNKLAMKATVITDKQQEGRVQRALSNVSIIDLTEKGYTQQIDFAPIDPEAYNSKKLFRHPPKEPHFVDRFYESYRLYRLTRIDVLKCLRLLNSLQITEENLRKFYLSTGRIPSQDEADIISIVGVEKLISIINK